MKGCKLNKSICVSPAIKLTKLVNCIYHWQTDKVKNESVITPQIIKLVWLVSRILPLIPLSTVVQQVLTLPLIANKFNYPLLQSPVAFSFLFANWASLKMYETKKYKNTNKLEPIIKVISSTVYLVLGDNFHTLICFQNTFSTTGGFPHTVSWLKWRDLSDY